MGKAGLAIPFSSMSRRRFAINGVILKKLADDVGDGFVFQIDLTIQLTHGFVTDRVRQSGQYDFDFRQLFECVRRATGTAAYGGKNA